MQRHDATPASRPVLVFHDRTVARNWTGEALLLNTLPWLENGKLAAAIKGAKKLGRVQPFWA
jgi:hypothetical protein